MAWWIWTLIGLGLLALEAAAPGRLFALFFGLSGLTVGGLVAVGWGGPVGVQWLLFSAIAVAMLGALRGPLKARLNLDGAHKGVDKLTGEAALVLEEIPAGGVGKAEMRGSAWSARSATGALAKGARCRVERVEGLTLWLRPE